MQMVAYLRVSTESQLDGFGLDVQRKVCEAYEQAHAAAGWKIIDWYQDDAKSGTLEAHERPGLTAAIDRLRNCEKGKSTPDDDDCADALLVPRLDRLARSVGIQEAILSSVWRRKCAVHSAGDVEGGAEVLADDPDDPMRTAIRQMQGVFAQLERTLNNKRMRDGRKAKKDLGLKGDGVYPYGWSKAGEVDEEQVVLTRMLARRDLGWTFARVVDDLNNVGFRNRQGRPWSIHTVQSIVRRHRAPRPYAAQPRKKAEQ